MQDETREHGPQPLEHIMTLWNLTSHQLVENSTEQLNHKQIQRARKGRQLTLHLMQKITRDLNESILRSLPKPKRPLFVPYLHKHLFNYAKNHDPAWQDPNREIAENA